MKSWARHLVFGLLLALATPTASLLAAQNAEQILLDKANYWRLKDRPDLAIEALQKLLSINPNNSDALYQYGVLQVQQGKIDDARGYLARLQKAAPSSPHVTDLENAIRAGQVSPSELSEARKLAQSGQFSQAAQKYQQTFKGAPPPTFGVEYYMTLAGTPQGWDQAHKGLQALVQSSPNDSKAKLALAEIETYRAETRARGVHALMQLTDDPVVGTQATQAWKRSLMWLGGSAADRALYNEYMAKFPQDAEVRQQMTEAGKGGGGAGPNAPGYAALNRGNLSDAERQFEAELGRNPNDPDALAGLGIVRLRQRRLPQARELLGRAITEFRRALAADPNNQAAQMGLRGALTAQHSADTAGRPGPAAAAAPVNPARARADTLRAEGQALEAKADVVGAAAKYQEAIAVDPSDPWARLDYARFLAHRGDVAQGFAVVDPAASGASPESFYAAALFYNEQSRPGEALALLDRIPAGSRPAAATALREQIFATAEIARAKQMAKSGNRFGARNALMALAARPPVTAEKNALIADALTDIGFGQEALQLARPNPATAGSNKKPVLDYAALLLRSGRDAEATAYLTQAEGSGRITARDRQELEHIKVDIASKRADDLREHGDLAGAWDQISALLAAYPNDPTLLLTAGRIYAAAGQNSVAMRFVDAAFRQAPNDVGVIRGAIGGAIVAGDLDRARAYLAHGMQAFPNNPRLYYMEAEIARSSGDNGTAISSLQIARQLDNPQAGLVEALPPLPRGGPVLVPGPGAPSNLPPNPFRRVEADGARPRIQLAAATNLVSATDAVDAPAPSTAPLQQTAVSADSDDLIVPPRAAERPPRPAARPAMAPPAPRVAALPPAGEADGLSGTDDTGQSTPVTGRTRRVAQGAPQPLAPPPIQGYQPPYYYPQQPAYPARQSVQQPVVYQAPQPAYYTPQPGFSAPLQPLPPPPIPGYQPPPGYGQSAAPAPRDSLEADIDRSMAAIVAEAGPTMQGGFAFRARDGEEGLSRLTEIGVPVEGTFSPFYTGTVRLQVVPTFLDAGRVSLGALTRFGHEALLALNPANNLGNIPRPGSQTASGVSLNAAYAYQIFDGEIGTTPLGFRVENLVGRLALEWPGPAVPTTAYPPIPLAPTNVANPVTVRVEGVRKPVTESLLSYGGTKDPVTGMVWGGVIKTGGDALVSYDDGDVGVYGGGGAWAIDGKSVQSNSEFEGLVGAYVRPYRVGTNAFKIGLNLSYMGYDRNLRFFTFGQGGYFSPQTYFNVGVPLEYSGRSGRFTYLAGGAIGVQTFNERSSPYFPIEPARQAALRGAFGNLAFYPSRNVTGPAFNAKGQVEYQLNNGFVVGGLATIDNAQNFTEGIAKVYLRKSFGVVPSTALLPYSAGSL